MFTLRAEQDSTHVRSHLWKAAILLIPSQEGSTGTELHLCSSYQAEGTHPHWPGLTHQLQQMKELRGSQSRDIRARKAKHSPQHSPASITAHIQTRVLFDSTMPGQWAPLWLWEERCLWILFPLQTLKMPVHIKQAVRWVQWWMYTKALWWYTQNVICHISDRSNNPSQYI